MKTQPLKGMRDLLPREQALRDYIQGQILATYRAAGFQRISTPILEDMENLDKSDGGDNLNLIFKVLKRGDKLEKALATGDEKQLSDMGLRYDLTLPPLPLLCGQPQRAAPPPSRSSRPTASTAPSVPRRGSPAGVRPVRHRHSGGFQPQRRGGAHRRDRPGAADHRLHGFTVNINDRRILRAMLEKMGFALKIWIRSASASTSWTRSAPTA